MENLAFCMSNMHEKKKKKNKFLTFKVASRHLMIIFQLGVRSLKKKDNIN